jgi:hypothetical protein
VPGAGGGVQDGNVKLPMPVWKQAELAPGQVLSVV